jgi:hypothetical protein
MNFEYARKLIQSEVKEILGVAKSPKQASQTAIVQLLKDMGLAEPYNRDQCMKIVNIIVSAVRKEENSIALIEDESITELNETMNENEDITEIEEQESNELAFSSKFEKAEIIQAALADNQITVPDNEALEMAINSENTYASRETFISRMIELWSFHRDNQRTKEMDNVINQIATLKATEHYHDNQLRSLVTSASTEIDAIDKRFQNDFEQFVNNIINRG